MNTSQLASLEDDLQRWLEDQAENDKLPTDVFYPDKLNVLMAKAAAAVFDASRTGQEYSKEQEPSK